MKLFLIVLLAELGFGMEFGMTGGKMRDILQRIPRGWVCEEFIMPGATQEELRAICDAVSHRESRSTGLGNELQVKVNQLRTRMRNSAEHEKESIRGLGNELQVKVNEFSSRVRTSRPLRAYADHRLNRYTALDSEDFVWGERDV